MEHCKHKPKFDFRVLLLSKSRYVNSGTCKHCGKQIVLARPVKVKIITCLLEAAFLAFIFTVMSLIMELCTSWIAMLFCIFSMSIVGSVLLAILTGYVIPACSKWVPYVPEGER